MDTHLACSCWGPNWPRAAGRGPQCRWPFRATARDAWIAVGGGVFWVGGAQVAIFWCLLSLHAPTKQHQTAAGRFSVLARTGAIGRRVQLPRIFEIWCDALPARPVPVTQSRSFCSAHANSPPPSPPPDPDRTTRYQTWTASMNDPLTACPSSSNPLPRPLPHMGSQPRLIAASMSEFGLLSSICPCRRHSSFELSEI